MTNEEQKKKEQEQKDQEKKEQEKQEALKKEEQKKQQQAKEASKQPEVKDEGAAGFHLLVGVPARIRLGRSGLGAGGAFVL